MRVTAIDSRGKMATTSRLKLVFGAMELGRKALTADEAVRLRTYTAHILSRCQIVIAYQSFCCSVFLYWIISSPKDGVK